MPRRIAILTFLAVALAFSIPSRADNDGFFCTSKGYLAYELRHGVTAGISGHVLKVVRFEPRRGIYIAGEVPLQDFQVHTMTCEKDRIEISGWGNMFKKYTVDITSQRPGIIQFTEDPTRQFNPSTEGSEPSNFGFAPAGRLALESPDPDHKYVLLLSASEKNVEGGVQHHRKAELVQTDVKAKAVSQRLLLYENKSLETID